MRSSVGSEIHRFIKLVNKMEHKTLYSIPKSLSSCVFLLDSSWNRYTRNIYLKRNPHLLCRNKKNYRESAINICNFNRTISYRSSTLLAPNSQTIHFLNTSRIYFSFLLNRLFRPFAASTKAIQASQSYISSILAPSLILLMVLFLIISGLPRPYGEKTIQILY